MGITGWIDHARDLRQQRPALNAIAAALGPSQSATTTVRISRHTAFAARGVDTGYADWRCLERPDPDLSIVVDGHLDNRSRLEDRLYRRHHPLRSDAEVILHAYREWGAGIVEHLEGAYAIGIWDNRARQLLLIRDRLGLKTLFHAPQPHGTLFASRATALLAHPDVSADVDADGLNELITMYPARSPGHAILRGVHEVPPGRLVRITSDGTRTHRYGALHADEHGEDLDTTVARIRRLLEENTVQLPEHRPVSVLLSGGVASGAAAALTAARYQTAAFTLTLTGPGSPPTHGGADAGTAALTAARLGLQHTVTAAGTDDLLAAGPTARTALDFPGQPTTDTTVYELLQHISAHARFAVSGDGANVVFGGYRWQHDPQALSSDDFPWRHRTVAPLDLLNADAHTHLVPGAYRKERYDAATADIPYGKDEPIPQRRYRRAAHLVFTHYRPHLLARIDQLATAAGVSIRMPFVDPRLAQYAWNIPHPLRQLLGNTNGLLRHTVADLLPPEVTWQPSLRFPSADLLQPWQAAQRADLHEIITDPASPVNALLDLHRTRQLIEQPPTHAREWHATIAYLIELNAWLTAHRIAFA